MKHQTVLITGAGGFLGSQLNVEFTKRNYTVLLTSGHSNNNPQINDIPLSDFNKINSFINEARPDILIHAGSFVDLSHEFTIAKECINSNITGTLNLLEALCKHPPKKIIYTSTEEIYGDGPVPFHENQLPRPPSLYSISKLAAEQMCQMYAEKLGYSLVILRISTFYGPEQPERRFIPQMIQQALKGENVRINSGIKKRDYIYISDVVDGILQASDVNMKNQIETINLGGGTSYTLEYLANQIILATQSNSRLVKNAFPDRSWEADEWRLDISKAKKILRWEPKINLAQGIAEEVRYLKNKWTY